MKEPKQKSRLSTASNESTGVLKPFCGQPTLEGYDFILFLFKDKNVMQTLMLNRYATDTFEDMELQ